MVDDDFFMSDTLDNLLFSDIKSQSKDEYGIVSDEISFDDSRFLKNALDSNESDSKKSLCTRDDISSENGYQEQHTKCLCSSISSDCKRNGNCTNSKRLALKHTSTKENIVLCKKPALEDLAIDPTFCPSTGTYNTYTNGTEIIHKVNDKYKLSAWGLPDLVLQRYALKRIENMFAWQFECLSNPKVLNECSNLIYSAPTSSGKTLVAEILALKTVFERKKKVILILPFISIVREKMYYFQDILSSSGIRADGFMGSYNPPGGFTSVDFAICTIEKANSLINKLLEEGQLSEVGSVVVDEMHLLGDSHRGYILELLLTKLRYICLKDNTIQIQIIGMSATLPNLNQLAMWLGAELYSTTFRPIPLYEQACVSGEIFDKNFQLIKKLEFLPDIDKDTDNILQLCLDTIKDSHSVLIFCPTKNWCENLAQQLSQAFFKIGNSPSPLGELLRFQIKSELILEVLEQLKFCFTNLDPVLKKTVSFGIGFHHAGLTMDERDVIEGAFRKGVLKILVATSTLSCGVNLPARRVLIRSPNFCGKPLDVLTYRQMIGRAGRMGKDSKGESILICQKHDYAVAKQLMSGEVPAVESCLEGAGKLKRAILEIIASGIASTPDDVSLFTSCTLLAVTHSNTKDFQDPIGDVIKFLKEFEFIRLQKTNEYKEIYIATSLGKACLSSSIAPDEGLSLFTELEKARQCFVLETELHLIYLVTPYSACNSWGNIDWMFYFDLWDKLSPAMKRVGELVGIKESYIINATRGKIQTDTSKAYHNMMVHKRFFVALALQDLVNEIPLGDVCSKFSCNRGMLQSLQQSAATFAGMVTSFSRQLGWTSVELLLAQFQDRMQFGVSRDLLDLMRLPSLNGQLARILYNNSIETLIQLANSDVSVVENILFKARPFESSKKRECESEFENKQRNELRRMWISGKEGLTEKETAELLVKDARNYLQSEMGLKEAKWTQSNDNEISANQISQSNALFGKKNSNSTNSDISEKIVNNLDMPLVKPHVYKSTQKEFNALKNNNITSQTKLHFVEYKEYNGTKNSLSETTSDKLCESDNISNISNTLSNLSFNKFEDKLDNVVIASESKSPAAAEIKVRQPFEVLSTPSLNVSLLKSSFNFEDDESLTDSFSLQLSNESSDTKTGDQARQSFDDFESQGDFESLLQNIDISQAIKTNTNQNFNQTKRKNKSNLSSSSEDSFLGASPILTPSKRLKFLDQSDSPFIQKSRPHCNNAENVCNETIHFSKLHIVDVCYSNDLIDTFFNELRSKTSISFCVICTKELKYKPTIGANIITSQRGLKTLSPKHLIFNDMKIEGFAFCWGRTESYFLSTKDCHVIRQKIINKLKAVFADAEKSVLMFDAKEHIKLLKQCCDIDFNCKLEDLKVADWLLDSDGKEKSLQIMASCYRQDLNDIARLCGKINSAGSFGLDINSTADPKLRGSVEVVVLWHLLDALKEKLSIQIPTHNTITITGFPTNYDLEMRTMLCVANMELCGMSISKTSLQQLVDLLNRQRHSIEQKVYSLIGRKIRLSSSTDVSKAVGTYRGKKVSTKKQVLQQNDHPVSELILTWRKINFVLKMVTPLIRTCENNRLYGSYVCHTATGRITMREPNIQMMPKDFSIIDPISAKDVLISCRSAFNVPDEYILVSADYCQLELRILTYLSKDKLLTNIMKSPADIFKQIAAKWNNINEEMVDDNMRQNAKQLCYGIIYGMGAKTLAEQLGISEEDATQFMESFRNTYSGVKQFIKETLDLAKKNGYVETITGRRRYLTHIAHADPSIKSHAERQAVNSTVQGSAADIVKNAMIVIEDKINLVFKKSRFKPKLTLNLHDELIYEVPEKYVEKTVKIIKKGMENSASVFGYFPVKIRTGKSWGHLKEYCNKSV